MRRAKPHELSDHAVPVMTARITEAELAKWFPIPFDELSDPLEVPEPSRGALVQLDNGAFIVLNYGKESSQLTVEFPESIKDRSALIAAFFREVPLPAARVLWYRRDMRLPKPSAPRSAKPIKTRAKGTASSPGATNQRKKRSALRATLPKKRR